MTPSTFIALFAYPLMLTVYYVMVGLTVFDGYFRDLIGHSHGNGHHHSKLHKVLWQYHTGMHVNPARSFGDEARLKKTAGATNRATPEGSIVYFTRWRRGTRALRNNGVVWIMFAIIYGVIMNAFLTINLLTIAAVLSLFGIAGLAGWKIRKRIRARPARKLARARWDNIGSTKTMVPRKDEPTVYVSGGVITETKPKLDGGIPASIMAGLLAAEIGASPMETEMRLKIGPDRGSLALPDTFPALERQRAIVQEIISANTSGRVSFSWATSAIPRTVSWVPVVRSLPDVAPFRDYIAEMEKLPRGDFGVGLDMDRKMYVMSHRGDRPWSLRSAGSGTGKSVGFQVKLAQICHNDPMAEVYCVDTKQVSFENMHGIPRVHIFDNPVTEMDRIYNIFYTLNKIMRDRYTAVRKREARYEDFDDIWLLVDEGNDLGTHIRAHYEREVKETGDPAQPPVWRDAIEPLRNLGRQVHIRGEWMFQNMTDRALGGISLASGWGEIGMAGYDKKQWGRIVGTQYVEPKEGPGRIMMVRGNQQTWVQGFYEDPENGFLRDYALASRTGE